MKLYDYAASANCYKVRLLLAQLDRPYERVHIDIFAGDTLTEEYAAKNPARATPVLELEDGALLLESNAILFYLAQGTPFLPAAPLEVAQVVRWLVFEQTDVMDDDGRSRFPLLWMRLGHPDGVLAGRRDICRVTLLHEPSADQAGHLQLVLHDQDTHRRTS